MPCYQVNTISLALGAQPDLIARAAGGLGWSMVVGPRDTIVVKTPHGPITVKNGTATAEESLTPQINQLRKATSVMALKEAAAKVGFRIHWEQQQKKGWMIR